MTVSAAVQLCCGADEAEYRRRAAAINRDPDELRRSQAAGTPDEVAARLRDWNAAGADRIYLQVLDLADLEHLDLVAEHVAPELD
jgi:alkanesulfonate monooxygenase SsuD/methylene tetrahydromethanopterin reductase-like flavin-dependent oxidoreductase (luciferase family)